MRNYFPARPRHDNIPKASNFNICAIYHRFCMPHIELNYAQKIGHKKNQI